MSSDYIFQKLPVLEVVGETGHAGGVSPGRSVLVGNVGVLCSVLHEVTVRMELFSTMVGLDSRLAGEGLWEGIRTCGIN